MLRMSDFAKEGQLSERAKPDQFKGSYAEIVKGVNTTLDAILVPTMESNRILVQIRMARPTNWWPRTIRATMRRRSRR